MPRHLPAAAAFLATLIAGGAALAQDDLVADGKKVFRRCAACHKIGDDASNGVGPQLNGIVGRSAGSVDDYSYSDALAAAGADGLVWDEETLHAWLESPKDLVPGNKMAFVGLRKPEEIDAVIAFMSAQGD